MCHLALAVLHVPWLSLVCLVLTVVHVPYLLDIGESSTRVSRYSGLDACDEEDVLNRHLQRLSHMCKGSSPYGVCGVRCSRCYNTSLYSGRRRMHSRKPGLKGGFLVSRYSGLDACDDEGIQPQPGS